MELGFRLPSVADILLFAFRYWYVSSVAFFVLIQGSYSYFSKKSLLSPRRLYARITFWTLGLALAFVLFVTVGQSWPYPLAGMMSGGMYFLLGAAVPVLIALVHIVLIRQFFSWGKPAGVLGMFIMIGLLAFLYPKGCTIETVVGNQFNEATRVCNCAGAAVGEPDHRVCLGIPYGSKVESRSYCTLRQNPLITIRRNAGTQTEVEAFRANLSSIEHAEVLSLEPEFKDEWLVQLQLDTARRYPDPVATGSYHLFEEEFRSIIEPVLKADLQRLIKGITLHSTSTDIRPVLYITTNVPVTQQQLLGVVQQLYPTAAAGVSKQMSYMGEYSFEPEDQVQVGIISTSQEYLSSVTHSVSAMFPPANVLIDACMDQEPVNPVIRIDPSML
jgi:hypothetical protein